MLTRQNSIRQEDFLDGQRNTKVDRPPRICLRISSGAVIYEAARLSFGGEYGDLGSIVRQLRAVLTNPHTRLVRRTI